MAYTITNDCAGCGTCEENCPTGAIKRGSPYRIDPADCLECGSCEAVCPNGAIVGV
ncbi:MAG: 4Fe-4S binding protein [Candidatus Baltobacteraceae bacterium]|jgi:NAD-dependent dihydropyrimidine dehydrogenase PreA subunit